jgi:hypothetical protein
LVSSLFAYFKGDVLKKNLKIVEEKKLEYGAIKRAYFILQNKTTDKNLWFYIS